MIADWFILVRQLYYAGFARIWIKPALTYLLDVGSNSVIATPILLKPPIEEGEAREILEEIKTNLQLYGLHIKVINCIREFYELFNTVFADCTLINEGEEN